MLISNLEIPNQTKQNKNHNIGQYWCIPNILVFNAVVFFRSEMQKTLLRHSRSTSQRWAKCTVWTALPSRESKPETSFLVISWRFLVSFKLFSLLSIDLKRMHAERWYLGNNTKISPQHSAWILWKSGDLCWTFAHAVWHNTQWRWPGAFSFFQSSSPLGLLKAHKHWLSFFPVLPLAFVRLPRVCLWVFHRRSLPWTGALQGSVCVCMGCLPKVESSAGISQTALRKWLSCECKSARQRHAEKNTMCTCVC